MATVEIEGIQEMLDQLQALGERAGQIEDHALLEAGEVVKDRITDEVPVRSGVLKRSINRSKVRVLDGVKVVSIGPGKKGWYGKFLEFGTIKARANPFMTRGYEASKDQAFQKIKEALRRGLML